MLQVRFLIIAYFALELSKMFYIYTWRSRSTAGKSDKLMRDNAFNYVGTRLMQQPPLK